MAENSAGSPVFADRYKFQTVGNDWDRGRSGFTHLVFDIKEERLGVIKRAEIKSQQAVEGLKNEVAALLHLKGLGVPELYDTGKAEYGSKIYFYMVIEYIEGIRIEKNLGTLSAHERAEILTQFFGLLTKSHQLGIVNGDVDLKHLFWRRDKKQLIVIDWGNAKLDVNPKKKNEFAYDLARAAEIIYSLVTLKGHPSATGSIALPNESMLVPGLASLPTEFRDLCKWAPRTPSEGAQSPHTAQELFEASKAWHKAVHSAKPFKSTKHPNWGLRLLFGLIIGFAIILGLSPNSLLYPWIYSKTSTVTVIAPNTILPTVTETIVPSKTPSPIATSTVILTLVTESTTPTLTPYPVVTPSPGKYSPILIFNNKLSLDNCWVNESISPSKLILNDGFYRRADNYEDWGFKIVQKHPIEDVIQVDFSQCLQDKKIGALALNVAVQRLDIPAYPPNEPAREFGIFLVNQKGQRREYTIWWDKDGIMYLRVRENNNEPKGYPILVVSSANLHLDGEYPRPFLRFPIQIFLEINNQGLDIIYLLEGSFEKSVAVEDIDPSQMIRIDNGVLPTIGDIQQIGLVGHGGQIETLIWPLAFLENMLK